MESRSPYAGRSVSLTSRQAIRAGAHLAVLALVAACGSSPDAGPEPGNDVGGTDSAGGAPGASGAFASGGSSSGGSSFGGSAGAGGQTNPLGAGGAATAGGGVGGGGGGGGGAGPTSSFDIHIDYKFDSQGAFTPDRRTVLEAAAHAWEQLILSEFDDIPEGTALRTRDPEHTTDPGVVFPAAYAIDDLAVFVGFTAIDGVGADRAVSSFSFTQQVTDPVLLARLTTRFYQIPFQPWVGNTGFDVAEDWFYDPTPETDGDIPAAQSDFMTTSLHELGHLLGIGNSAAWDGFVNNGHFDGPHAVALNGGPVLLSADLHHVDKTLLMNGTRDLMANATLSGQRLRPTALDVAILEDLGYQMVH
jgi:hypothetical protein